MLSLRCTRTCWDGASAGLCLRPRLIPCHIFTNTQCTAREHPLTWRGRTAFNSDFKTEQNPEVQFYQSRVTASEKYADLLKKSILPGVNLFGIVQTRGSGSEPEN